MAKNKSSSLIEDNLFICNFNLFSTWFQQLKLKIRKHFFLINLWADFLQYNVVSAILVDLFSCKVLHKLLLLYLFGTFGQCDDNNYLHNSQWNILNDTHVFNFSCLCFLEISLSVLWRIGVNCRVMLNLQKIFNP